MMHLTPQSMRSPVSPYDQQSKQSFSAQPACYPKSPRHDSVSTEHQPNRGLGLFGCSLPPSQPIVTELPPSPQTSEAWSHSSMMEQDYAQSSSQPPDIFSAAFDPFSGFSTASNTGMANVHSPEAPGLDYCQSPPSSNVQSHRGSVSSSYSEAESFSQHGSNLHYTPRVKVEDTTEWYPAAGNEQVLQRAVTTQGLPTYPTISPINGHTEDLYRSQSGEWPKADGAAYMNPSSDGRLAQFDVQPILPSVTRIKKKRQRTTPEEATHECRVCGKLFKRSYNWKSHMETHNPERKYPHPCTQMIGNTPCTKKFQRKTDLDRHVDSVHLKARNHRCNLCGNRFARRDTLRRHTEDGCPKRFELGIREGSVATPARWSFTNFPGRGRSYSLGMPQSSPMAPPPSMTTSATFPALSRPQFLGLNQASTAPGSSGFP